MHAIRSGRRNLRTAPVPFRCGVRISRSVWSAPAQDGAHDGTGAIPAHHNGGAAHGRVLQPASGMCGACGRRTPDAGAIVGAADARDPVRAGGTSALHRHPFAAASGFREASGVRRHQAGAHDGTGAIPAHHNGGAAHGRFLERAFHMSGACGRRTPDAGARFGTADARDTVRAGGISALHRYPFAVASEFREASGVRRPQDGAHDGTGAIPAHHNGGAAHGRVLQPASGMCGACGRRTPGAGARFETAVASGAVRTAEGLSPTEAWRDALNPTAC